MDIATQFSALKMIWIRRLLDNNYHPWKLIPTKLFSPLGSVTFFHSNLKLADSSLRLVKTLSTFYQELANLWANISQQNPTTSLRYVTRPCGIIVFLQLLENLFFIRIS